MAKEPNQITETRAAFGKRLGEIIESTLGDDRIRVLFDQAGKHPEEHAGKSTGQIALEQGVITADTKTALLVAQAAERTLQLADKVVSFAAAQDKIVSTLKDSVDHEAREKQEQETRVLRMKSSFLERMFNPPEAPRVSYDEKKSLLSDKAYAKKIELGYVDLRDPAFKFFGSERDPDILKSAQMTQFAAQMLHNNNLDSRLSYSLFPADVGFSQADTGYADGLKAKAAQFYGAAAELLHQEGHTDAARKLSAVADSVSNSIANKNAPGPQELVKKLQESEEWSLARSNQEMAMWSSSSFGYRHGFDPESCARVCSMIALTDTAPKCAAAAPAAKPLKMSP